MLPGQYLQQLNKHTGNNYCSILHRVLKVAKYPENTSKSHNHNFRSYQRIPVRENPVKRINIITNNFDRQRKLLALNVNLWPLDLHHNQMQKNHPTFVMYLNFRNLMSMECKKNTINVASADPEPQLLFDGRLVLTSTPKKPKRRIEDIATWMEAFSVYCLIMISFFPHRSRDLLQYKLLILRTYRQFSGKVWLAYDRAFREHAAAANVVDWSSINVQLFNFHAAGASARGPNVSSPDSSEPAGASTSQILCKSWNKGRCVAPYASCRYAHRCSSCSGAHRAVNCPGSEPAQPPVKSSRRSRSPSRSSSKSRRT